MRSHTRLVAAALSLLAAGAVCVPALSPAAQDTSLQTVAEKSNFV
ncbi:MAG: hypothetical protein QOI59_6436, partial [Gammaproteobacteria bacterium]|nr:hypothetical protein [Gammaproteobacteria bacterium]